MAKHERILSPTLLSIFLSDLVSTSRHQESVPTKLDLSVIEAIFLAEDFVIYLNLEKSLKLLGQTS